MLPKESWEENFGLYVTLNSIDPQKIRQVDRLGLEGRGRHTKTQVGQAAPIAEMGIDFDQELVREVVGSTEEEILGKRLSGTDQVKLTPKISLDNILATLEKLSEKFKEKTYLKTFPLIGRLEEVSMDSKITDLNNQVVKKLRKNDLDRMWMAVPEVVDWDEIGWFNFSSDPDIQFEDIVLEEFLKTLPDPSNLTLNHLTSRRIMAIGLSNETVLFNWTAFKCLYAEVEGEKETFILTFGKWYRVKRDFVEELSEYMSRVEYDDLTFPYYVENSEGEYNKAFCESKGANYVLMDARNITLRGQSAIEFCDIYSKDKKIIHVKHYRGSSGLSHLFNQGANSALLFLSEEEFRVKANVLLPVTHQIPFPEQKPISSDYTVIFAIITNDEFGDKLSLPFFSRITFRKIHKELSNYGFSVKLAKIRNSRARISG